MSHFYATIQGHRGEGTRTGTKTSGITSHTKGWNSGVRVRGFYNEETGEDEFVVTVTGGSNGRSSSKTIATIRGGKILPDTE